MKTPPHYMRFALSERALQTMSQTKISIALTILLLLAMNLFMLPAQAQVACQVDNSALNAMPTSLVTFTRADGSQFEIAARTANNNYTRSQGFQRVCKESIAAKPILFIFETVRRPSFHMHNVVAAIDIAFIQESGAIDSIQAMQPYSLVSRARPRYRPHSPVIAALEAHPDFFAEHQLLDSTVTWAIQDKVKTPAQAPELNTQLNTQLHQANSPTTMTEHLKWQSQLSLEQVFAQGQALAYPSLIDSQTIIYLTDVYDDTRRSCLVAAALQADDEPFCITPKPFSLATQIHEFGGKPFWLLGNTLVFANQADQCLYRQSLRVVDGQIISASPPQRISPLSAQPQHRFADVLPLSDDQFIAIVETENLAQSYLALIDAQQPDHAPMKLLSQPNAHFYSNLVMHGDSQTRKIAWVQWQHPHMPWDDSTLVLADLLVQDNHVQLSNLQPLELGAPVSVCQLLFASNGDLYFAADFANAHTRAENFWNLYCYSPDADKLIQISDLDVEFGYPHWQFGDHRLCQFDPNTILAIGSTPTHDGLYQINIHQHSIEKVAEQAGYQSLQSNQQGMALMLTHSTHTQASITCVQRKTNALVQDKVVQMPSPLEADNISEAQHLSFPTRDGNTAYGWYYAPNNSRYSSAQAPPLIVMVHGGPTAQAYRHFDLQKQFWTTRGFALFDVNYRGSSGYGRRYRDALYGQWGELDTSDIIDGVNFLLNQGLADKQRLCIRGKSAGGYAVLRVLTQYPEVFRAGACYYGIGNLMTLAQLAHRFEQHYTDQLLGQAYTNATSPQSVYHSRSPVFQIEKLRAAMIVFQGLRDKVVPPAVAQEIITVLRNAGIAHRYVEYADEGHGFKQIANNIDAWTQELAFYRQALTIA